MLESTTTEITEKILVYTEITVFSSFTLELARKRVP
jgi:hypothetical protein